MTATKIVVVGQGHAIGGPGTDGHNAPSPAAVLASTPARLGSALTPVPPGDRSDPVGCRKPIASGLSSSRQANSICPWAAFLQDNKACARMHRNCNAVEKQGCPMKTASIPSLRVAPALRQAAEEVLGEGESLSNFVEQSIRESIERRLAQREFIARGLASRDKAKQSGKYVSSDAVVGRLEKMLAQAKASSKTSG
jgi:predicted transcriptional regulator